MYQYSCLKAIKFLHYVITMPAFQADTLASTIFQFRKFIYQTLHETKNLYKLHVISCSDLTIRRQKDRQIIKINCRAYQATTKYINRNKNSERYNF